MSEISKYKPDCISCLHAYRGADEALRCRVHHNGLKCSPAAADGCKRYEPKPVTADRVWYCDQPGRGD